MCQDRDGTELIEHGLRAVRGLDVLSTYAEHAGHEAFGCYPSDFLWGLDIASLTKWCWHSAVNANENWKTEVEIVF
jgi:hypothetical protein